MGLGVFLIHTVKFASEKGSFVAAGAGTNFKNSRFIILGVAGDEEFF